MSLVASRRRAAVILERLKGRGAPPERLARLKAPAGLDIGAVTPQEIAVSILAEIIQHRRSQKTAGAETESAPAITVRIETKDPICGMIVDAVTAKFRSEFAGRTVSSAVATARRCSTRIRSATARRFDVPLASLYNNVDN